MPRSLFIYILLVGSPLLATPQSGDVSAPTEVINEVLFTVSGEVKTQRDLDLYRDLLTQIFQKKLISQYSKNIAEDFLLSQLAVREAAVFELRADVPQLTLQQKKLFADYPPTELERELRQVADSIALVEIKESQLKQRARFITWVELLRRKYQVRLKSSVYQQ